MVSYFKKILTEIFGRQTRKILAKHDPTIIAVAGSVGKTTTKMAIATVLSQSFRVRFQQGNYNTPISIPFVFTGREMPSLYNPFSWFWAWHKGQKTLRRKYPYDIVVVELGTDSPGDIANFKQLLHPKITVVTAVAEEHMEFFKDLEAVAKEELGVADYSEQLVINADDIQEEYLEKYVSKDVPMHSYGFKHAEYKITTSASEEGYEVAIELGGGQKVTTKTTSIAEHNLKAIAAAVAVGDLMGMEPDSIKKGINKIKAMPGRMQVLKGVRNSVIVDDTYNSSPIAVEAALKTIYGIKAPQRIAILGSMNELGEYSKEAHTRVGNYCDSSKLDLIVTIGTQANEFLAPVVEARGCKVVKTLSPYEAGKRVRDSIKPGAIILAKGSQNGVFAEEALKLLLANPGDVDKLVRQNKFWLKKKSQQFGDFPTS
ncbi:UDP-N-acetylmuramoyl-tripeptide--D-alanyl-D-alanine ligase [Candidatus Saccharibacteria bacterium]|nr:UDP-N-acetylmuramoyl-tripeptide--D-alanyl-D-alanine ligase [Candidatus Saccharibacteria bacterium]